MKQPTLLRSVRAELYKALHNKMLWIAIGIGLVMITMDLWEAYEGIRHAREKVIQWQAEGKDLYLGYSLFRAWIFSCSGTYGAGLLITIWPLLAAMAFGWSYNNERTSGVYNQVVSRIGIRRYFLSKHIAVFISGGLAHCIPIIINLLAMALIYPAWEHPSVLDSTFLSGLALASPWGFCIAMCGMSFLWGGATACICHCTGTYLRHGVMVVLVPYALYIIIDTVISVYYTLTQTTIFIQWSPRLLGAFFATIVNPGWLQFSYLILFTLGSYALGLWQVKKHELV